MKTVPALAEVVIETGRLRLVPTSEAYAQEIFANFTPEVTRYMFPAPAATIDDTLAFLRSARADLDRGETLGVVILLKETGEFLGHAGIHHVHARDPELGIWIKQGAHRNGYGREAVTALAFWALEHLRFEYLKYPVDRRNVASRRIPESLGGRVAREYEETNQSGFLLQLLEYRIGRADLEARRGGEA